MLESFSVVIPSYNGKEFLRGTLLALKKSSVHPLRCIVVDDFSSDGTFEMIKKEFPEVMAIRNEKNLGPTVSRNRGAKEAKGKYIVFVDNDVLVRPDSIRKLLQFLNETRDAGMAGGELIDELGKNIEFNMGGKLGRGFIKRYDANIEVAWIAEGFIAVKKELFEGIHGFDEDFFMTGEGPDLSERMRKVGFKTYFVKGALADLLEGHTHSKFMRKYWGITQFWKFWLKHGFKKR